MMTPEQLETLILNCNDSVKLQQAFAGLTTVERKALSTSAQKLRTQIMSGKADKGASAQLKRYLAKRGRHNWNGQSYSNATLGLFALAPRSALNRGDVFIGYHDREVIEQIIVDRKPDWLDEWVARDLDKEFSVVTFSMLRRWISEGICRKPVVDGYIRKFVWELMTVDQQRPKPPISRRLLAEPDLLDDVWRLFEIDSQAFTGAGWFKRGAGEDYETWPEALFRLMQEGHLDRRRLLDASLNGLSLDIKQNQLSGFHKFHERLSPDAGELRERQRDYLGLLNHRVGHVVKFALNMLGRLEKLDSLDDAAFLADAGTVFFQPGKGNVIAALKLIRRVLKKSSDLTETALRVAGEGLRHADGDVQAATLDLLHEHRGQMSGDFIEELRGAAAFLEAPLQPRLLALTGESDSEHTVSENDIDLEGLRARVSKLSANERSALGLDDESWFTPGEFALPPACGDIMRQTILPTVLPIMPIRDLEELIAAVSHAVEVVDSPDEVERIVDGISRLCGQKPGDFMERTAPLLHRLQTGAGLGTRDGIAGGLGGLRLAFADLLLTWLTGKRYRSSVYQYFVPTDALLPAITRIRDLTGRVAKGSAQPLLATPTHAGGWIDPLLWVERLIGYEREKIRFERMDFCLSLLRLTPDHRREALAGVSELSKTTARITGFALGGDESPDYPDRRDYDLWISAARSRAPNADWREVFSVFKLDDAWPDSLAPANFRWHTYIEENGNYQYRRIALNVSDGEREQPENGGPALGKLKRLLTGTLTTDWKMLPSAALNRQGKTPYNWDGDLNTTWVAKWLVEQWPLCPDAAYRAGILRLAGRIDMDGSNWEPSFGFLHGLFQKNRPWRESGHLLLCMGLTGKDADARGLAIDALIEGIEDGRADLSLLAEMLVRLARGGLLKLNRLGENLQQVGRLSPLHAWAVGDLIQRWLSEGDLKQHNLFKMLEVLLDVQTRIKQPLLSKTIDTLTALRGGSKAAKLAGQLRRLPQAESCALDRIRAQAIGARLGADSCKN